MTRPAVIPGGKVGQEVIHSGIAVMEAAAETDPSPELNFTEFPWDYRCYLVTAG